MTSSMDLLNCFGCYGTPPAPVQATRTPQDSWDSSRILGNRNEEIRQGGQREIVNNNSNSNNNNNNKEFSFFIFLLLLFRFVCFRVNIIVLFGIWIIVDIIGSFGDSLRFCQDSWRALSHTHHSNALSLDIFKQLKETQCKRNLKTPTHTHTHTHTHT